MNSLHTAEVAALIELPDDLIQLVWLRYFNWPDTIHTIQYIHTNTDIPVCITCVYISRGFCDASMLQLVRISP